MKTTPFAVSQDQAVSDSEGNYTYQLKRPATESEIIQQALAIIEQRHQPGFTCTKPKEVADYLVLKLAECRNEVFAVLFLNTRHTLIRFETLFTGTIDGCAVYPRVILERAIELNAAAVILAHNHPSGVSDPSHADRAITTRIKEVLELVEIRLLDHIIIGGTETTCFSERGFL